MRTAIGGGALLTFEKHSSYVHFGIAPFASASLEISTGKLGLSRDGRLARQMIGDAVDFTVYSARRGSSSWVSRRWSRRGPATRRGSGLLAPLGSAWLRLAPLGSAWLDDTCVRSGTFG